MFWTIYHRRAQISTVDLHSDITNRTAISIFENFTTERRGRMIRFLLLRDNHRPAKLLSTKFDSFQTSNHFRRIPRLQRSPGTEHRSSLAKGKWRFKSKKLSYPTASHSPIGQYPNEKIWELKLCFLSCFPVRRSHVLTVLSRPPVHNFVPSGEISMHDAPSVCPWNCLECESQCFAKAKA